MYIDLSEDVSITLSSDLASESPLYVYISDDKSCLIYSEKLSELLDHEKIDCRFTVDTASMSFLLQSGVVPSPKSIYKNFYLLSVGDKLVVRRHNDKTEIDFSKSFPFKNESRLSSPKTQVNEDYILELLAETTINKIDPNRPSYLFHSAGKDSNMLALALAEAGWQDRITLITHKSKGLNDESGISKKIAKKLGFHHQVLHEVDSFGPVHRKAIEDYFARSLLPCTDSVSLAYPLYALQLPELKGANLIDGMGNDVFIGHIPSQKEFKNANIARYASAVGWLGDLASCTSLLFSASRSRIEKVGFSGMSFRESRMLISDAIDTATYWREKDELFSNVDYLDVRAELRGGILDQEVFIRKVRNFADAYDSNLILPWANENVAKFFSKIPENVLFNRSLLKNKLILRSILKDRIGLDSDSLGKMGFSYDYRRVVQENIAWFRHHILSCDLWCKSGVTKLLDNYQSNMFGVGRKSEMSRKMIYRLFLISIWCNERKNEGLLNA